MSEPHAKMNPEQEQYAFSVTRKLFKFTIVGTVLFAGSMIAIWYFFE